MTFWFTKCPSSITSETSQPYCHIGLLFLVSTNFKNETQVEDYWFHFKHLNESTILLYTFTLHNFYNFDEWDSSGRLLVSFAQIYRTKGLWHEEEWKLFFSTCIKTLLKYILEKRKNLNENWSPEIAGNHFIIHLKNKEITGRKNKEIADMKNYMKN